MINNNQESVKFFGIQQVKKYMSNFIILYLNFTKYFKANQK